MDNSSQPRITNHANSTPLFDDQASFQTPDENVCAKLQSDSAALNEWNTRVAEIRQKDA